MVPENSTYGGIKEDIEFECKTLQIKTNKEVQVTYCECHTEMSSIATDMHYDTWSSDYLLK